MCQLFSGRSGELYTPEKTCSVAYPGQQGLQVGSSSTKKMLRTIDRVHTEPLLHIYSEKFPSGSEPGAGIGFHDNSFPTTLSELAQGQYTPLWDTGMMQPQKNCRRSQPINSHSCRFCGTSWPFRPPVAIFFINHFIRNWYTSSTW